MKPIYLIALICVLCFVIHPIAAYSVSETPQVSFTITKQPNGETIEQKNIIERLINDNKPGAIKHLYVISPYSGQVILYSTVVGKVTSSGKRVRPNSVYGGDGWAILLESAGFTNYYTTEIMQDDGTYGESAEYIFWWDVRGVYHQHYTTGGQIIHVSSEPIAVKDVIINIEQKTI